MNETQRQVEEARARALARDASVQEEKDEGTCGKSHTFATPLVPGRALAIAIK